MTTFYYNAECSNIHILLGEQLNKLLIAQNAYDKDIIIMCIGSDRSTGDSLGPIVGYHLSDCNIKNVYIYGDLFHPINATNLSKAIEYIKKVHANSFIIAIDACLGQQKHIGYITLAKGPLAPGMGIKNELPKVGDIHITGIVNTFDNGSHLLHSTRLCTVVTLAKAIENSIRWTFQQSLSKL